MLAKTIFHLLNEVPKVLCQPVLRFGVSSLLFRQRQLGHFVFIRQVESTYLTANLVQNHRLLNYQALFMQDLLFLSENSVLLFAKLYNLLHLLLKVRQMPLVMT